MPAECSLPFRPREPQRCAGHQLPRRVSLSPQASRRWSAAQAGGAGCGGTNGLGQPPNIRQLHGEGAGGAVGLGLHFTRAHVLTGGAQQLLLECIADNARRADGCLLAAGSGLGVLNAARVAELAVAYGTATRAEMRRGCNVTYCVQHDAYADMPCFDVTCDALGWRPRTRRTLSRVPRPSRSPGPQVRRRRGCTCTPGPWRAQFFHGKGS